MKKILYITAILIFALSTVSFASPATDYSQGKVAIDISIRPNMDLDFGGNKLDGKSSNPNLGVTIGLGNKMAFQYRNDAADSKSYTFGGSVYGIAINGEIHGDFKAQEYNLLYKIDKNLTALVGLTNAKGSLKASGTIGGQPGSIDFSGKDSNGYQVGLIGTTKLAEKANAYGIISAGNKITNYEVGVSYEFTKNAEFNLFYRDTTYKGIKVTYGGVDSPDFDYKAKGMGYGITYKF